MNKKITKFISAIFVLGAVCAFFSCSDTNYAVSHIDLDKTNVVIAKGESVSLKAVIHPAKAANNILIWTVTGENKDNVVLSSRTSESGKSITLTANEAGNFTIKATANCTDSADCVITAKKPLNIDTLPSDGVITTKNDEVLTFEGFKKIFTLLPKEGDAKSLDFSSCEISIFKDGTQNSPIIPKNAKLSSLVLPESLKRVPSYLATGNTTLTDVTLFQNVTAIGVYAFSGCTSVKVVTIPKTVTSISFEKPKTGNDADKMTAFKGCSALVQSAKNQIINLGYKNSDGTEGEF